MFMTWIAFKTCCFWIVHDLFINCLIFVYYYLEIAHYLFITGLLLFFICSQLINNCFMKCLWLVHYFFLICSLSGQELSWLGHDLFMATLKLLPFLTTFQILLVHDFFTSYTQFVTDLFLTCSLLAHFLFLIDFFYIYFTFLQIYKSTWITSLTLLFLTLNNFPYTASLKQFY